MIHPQIIQGDALEELRKLPADSVDCIVTSPPYWKLRDYGHPQQLGQEDDPRDFVRRLADVFDEARRVLKPTGTCWINIGDSYAAAGHGGSTGKQATNKGTGTQPQKPRTPPPGFKKKDIIGIPWRLSFALQDRGWYLRQDIIWNKPNAMPESVTDRCSKSH